MFEILDGELAIVHNGHVTHVFERGNLSRTAYNYMISWIQKNKTPDDNPEDSWSHAEAAWDATDSNIQVALWQITNQEQQNAKDIRDGLLATLHEYQGFTTVKKAFSDAIQACFSRHQ